MLPPVKRSNKLMFAGLSIAAAVAAARRFRAGRGDILARCRAPFGGNADKDDGPDDGPDDDTTEGDPSDAPDILDPVAMRSASDG